MKTLSFALLITFLVSACSQPQTAEGSKQTAEGSSQRSDFGSQTSDASNAALQNQIAQIAAEAKGKVGVLAVVVEKARTEDSGLRTEKKADDRRQEAEGTRQEAELRKQEALVSLNPQERFPMQSVYKLPISMAVMKLVDAGKIKLTDKVTVSRRDMVGSAAHSPIRDKHPNGVSLAVEELLRYALSESDGTASDVLMKLAGGPPAVQAYLTELSIKDMIVLDTEQALAQDHSLQFRNYSTPEAAVALLRALHERRGLSEPSQSLLLKFMTESTPGAKRLKGLLPPGTPVAHKTGTSGTENGVTAATNDIGIITLPTGRHLAIAVFVADSPADQETREGVIAKIAKAVLDSER